MTLTPNQIIASIDAAETKPILVSELLPYARNAKIHEDWQVAEIASSIKEFGFISPVIIDENGGIIAGHGRVLAALKLGLDRVPARMISHLTSAQKKAYVLVDNRLGEKAKYDEEMLALELADISMEMDLSSIGLDNWLGDTVDAEASNSSSDKDPDDIPTDYGVARVKPGELWQLGSHLLYCGSCLDVSSLEILFGDDKTSAALCFTSPPYSDQREYNGGKDLSVQALARFIGAASPYCDLFAVNLGLARKNHEVVRYWDDYLEAASTANLKLLSWNIWDKGEAGSVGNQTAMFAITHEFIFVFGEAYSKLNLTVPNKNAGYLNDHIGDRQKDGSVKRKKDVKVREFSQLKTILALPPQKARDEYDHPARFPVALPQAYIEACTAENDLVYEPFAGSGSTLIACEQTKRSARCIELDPSYCSMILRRWEQFTGQQAVCVKERE